MDGLLDTAFACGSPRWAAVVACARELIKTGIQRGTNHFALCGSVARCEDGDESDIDFYVFEFGDPDASDARARANQLVKDSGRILQPFGVDIRGIPGWPVDRSRFRGRDETRRHRS